ncbi:hypothetical protein I317_04304 [Kwoniella heveanensis CBS 569]|uniref:Homeobox domain-containing protein n=1 Tax=Kwoniella heveanensis BCC8398 TaxID=1296120 RepID=A0A1B9GPH7_9TREE|nr:hypothetical protein I316_05318 [Kwoniella heveanensis BCC8398]OCF41894.1 hypothetical protein I317_04304 [Kwoniella heveanensis CBS 569]
MSRPFPTPEEGKENSVFTLPPIRSLHATPKPTTHLPPTPSTGPPPLPGLHHARQDPNLVTPVQPRTRQPLASMSMNHHHPQQQQPLGGLWNFNLTPQSSIHYHPQQHPYSADPHPSQKQGTRPHQTPCPRPITANNHSIPSSASKQIQETPHPKELATPFKHTFGPTPAKTPVSALTNRTMGRSISTPTLPINSLPPMNAPFPPSTTNTLYSPSSESQRSTSASRSGVRGTARSHLSFSPSPTPSSSPTPVDLAGIQPPAPFPGAYPIAYTRKDPVPTDDEPEAGDGKRSGRQGAPSWNPWDYVLGEVPGGEQGPNQTPVKEGGDDGKGGKVRRRFTKRELEALEVLWSISKSPSKYERQRLGAWLGVKTKHITVWFQNRRQEEKRYLREGAPSDPPPPSRSNRGTFDPVTGKWRPVPLSCISGLQPPPEEKSAVVRSISVGDLTRDMYFAQHPHSEAHLPTPTPSGRTFAASANETPVPKRGNSNSLDNVLQARESGFGDGKRRYRQGSGESSEIQGEGQERIRKILALMPSDPPSMDLSELAADDDDSEEMEENEFSPKRKNVGATTSGGAMGLARMLNGPSRSGLGRATSLDVLASSSRAKSLSSKPLAEKSKPRVAPLGSINPNLPNHRATPNVKDNSLKHSLPLTGSPSQPSSKRARVNGPNRSRPATTFRHKDSFSRSQSAAVLESPEKANEREDRGELKTPGFTRSFSFSSTMSDGVAITPKTALLPKREPAELKSAQKQEGGKKPEERDAEVLGAAEKLLQLLGGA